MAAEAEEAKRVEVAEVQERGVVLRQENPWLSEILPGAPGGSWGKGIDYSRLGNASEEQLNTIANMSDGDLRAVFSDPSYGEWGDSESMHGRPSYYAPHMIIQARNKAKVELVKRQEPPNKWENFDWQSKIDPKQDYIYPNGDQFMGKTLIDMSKMGLKLEHMVDDLRLVTTLDGKLLYPPDEGVTQQQPVAEQPAADQPVAEPVGLVLLYPEPSVRLPCVLVPPLREGMHLGAVLGVAGLWFLVGLAAQASAVGEEAVVVVLLVLVDLPGLRSA